MSRRRKKSEQDQQAKLDQAQQTGLAAVARQLARCDDAADALRAENDERGAPTFATLQRVLTERALHCFAAGDLLDGPPRSDLYALGLRSMAEAVKAARHGHKDKYSEIEARLNERDRRAGAFAAARASRAVSH